MNTTNLMLLIDTLNILLLTLMIMDFRAAYFRLKSQYEKLCSELQIEKDVENSTVQTLEDAE